MTAPRLQSQFRPLGQMSIPSHRPTLYGFPCFLNILNTFFFFSLATESYPFPPNRKSASPPSLLRPDSSLGGAWPCFNFLPTPFLPLSFRAQVVFLPPPPAIGLFIFFFLGVPMGISFLYGSGFLPWFPFPVIFFSLKSVQLMIFL